MIEETIALLLSAVAARIATRRRVVAIVAWLPVAAVARRRIHLASRSCRRQTADPSRSCRRQTADPRSGERGYRSNGSKGSHRRQIFVRFRAGAAIAFIQFDQRHSPIKIRAKEN